MTMMTTKKVLEAILLIPLAVATGIVIHFIIIELVNLIDWLRLIFKRF
jgi:hypothetical protein